MASEPVESSLWCRGTLVLAVEGLGQRNQLTTAWPFVRCGSLDTCDVKLRGPGIPRRLLYLHATPQGMFALPLVELGRFAPLPLGWLLPKISLHIGPYRMSWQWECQTSFVGVSPSDPSKLPNLAEKGALKRRWNLEIFVDGCRVGQYELSRVLTLVGRHPPCHLTVTSRSVSGCHCVIIAKEDRLWFVDLCSNNGTRLEHQPLTAGEWPIGAALQLGRVVLVARSSHPLSSQPPGITLPQDSTDPGKVPDFMPLAGQTELASPHETGNVAAGPHKENPETLEGPARAAVPVNSVTPETPGEADRELDPPTFFTPPLHARIGAFNLHVLESVHKPESEESHQALAPSQAAIVGSEEVRDGIELTAGMPGPSLIEYYHTLAVQHEIVLSDSHPDLVGAEIIIEEGMQDNSLSAQAKDFVLRFFAEESISSDSSSGLTEGLKEPEDAPSFAEAEEEVPQFGFAETWVSAQGTPITDSLEKKAQELTIKEQILATWAKTLDQMSEAMLRLQEELVAEEDRFAEQQQSLEEQQQRLMAWHDELECRANKLGLREQELSYWQHELERRERAIQERHQILLTESHALAEQNQHLELLRKEYDDRGEKLAALETRLSQKERELQQKQEAIARQEVALRHQADRLAEEESKLHALQRDLEAQMNTLAHREEGLADRDKEQQESERKLADWEVSLTELRESLLRQEEDLKRQSERLIGVEQDLIRQQQELEKKRQGLVDQEQSLASRMQELTVRLQELAEKERRIAAQSKELDVQRRRLHKWEQDLLEQQSRLAALQPAMAGETSTLQKAAGSESGLLANFPGEGTTGVLPETEAPALSDDSSESTSAPVVTEETEPTRGDSVVMAGDIRRPRKPEKWEVIPLGKLRRRWGVPLPLAVALPTILLSACLVWWVFPRQFMTACRIEFPESSPLLYVRDGAWPAEAPKELLPQLTPVVPNTPDVVERLRRDIRGSDLVEEEKTPLDQLLASVAISKSEGLPFTTLSLKSRDPDVARHVLEKWGNIYIAFLTESLEAKITPALRKAKAEQQMKFQQLSDLRAKIEDLKAQYAADNPRQIELRARESLQMAELTEREIEQLTAEITIERERLEEARGLINNPERAVTDDEVLKALAERIEKVGLISEELQATNENGRLFKNAGEETRPGNEAKAGGETGPDDRSGPNREDTTDGAELPKPDNNVYLQSRYELLRELVRKELIENKREQALLTAQVLDAELESLEARLQMTLDRKSQYEAMGQSLQAAAKELDRLETEAASLERDCKRLETQIGVLQKTIAQNRMLPRLEAWCFQQQPWLPVAFAGLVAGIVMVPFGLWWLIRSRRITMLFPPSAFEHEPGHRQTEFS
ncbi:MAG: FHA domain-containing protein [Thermogutta sp.]